MNNQSTNQFKIYIPSEISSDSNLNLSEMKVLSTIKALDNENNCFASNSYLAECLGLSVRQVSRVISSLVKKCYILVENAKSFKRKIKLVKDKLTGKKEKVAEPVAPVKQDTELAKEEIKQVIAQEVKSKKASTYISKVSDKVKKYNSMASHDWNLDDLESLAMINRKRLVGAIDNEQYNSLAEPLLAKNHIS